MGNRWVNIGNSVRLYFYGLHLGSINAEADAPGHLMRRVDSLEKALMLGKIEGRRRREQHMMR